LNSSYWIRTYRAKGGRIHPPKEEGFTPLVARKVEEFTPTFFQKRKDSPYKRGRKHPLLVLKGGRIHPPWKIIYPKE
jgi:hypothetical protein